jgi:hypothetical protein
MHPHVFILLGEQVDPVDLRRCAAGAAKSILILPDCEVLYTPDQKSNQDANSLITWHLVKQLPSFSCIELGSVSFTKLAKTLLNLLEHSHDYL